MKIDSDKSVQPNLPLKRAASKLKDGAPSFAQVLEKSVETSASGDVRPPLSVQPVIKPMMASSSQRLYEQTDRMIDALEQYQTLLADNKVSLRDVAPALQRVKKEFETLAPLVEGLPQSHPMKQVASETVMTTAKEIARFEGGAYVPRD